MTETAPDHALLPSRRKTGGRVRRRSVVPSPTVAREPEAEPDWAPWATAAQANA